MLGARCAGLAGSLLLLGLSACSSDEPQGAAKGGNAGGGAANNGPPTIMGDSIGPAHEGVYHLGPVDFAESEWHNACAPGGGYRNELRETVGLSGEYLAGVANEAAQTGGVCDACILIETAMGKSIVARVVTYGVEHAAGDIDVSPSVFDFIHQNENPRSMTWHFARCPEAGGLKYEFQTEANPYWTSLWLRNPRVPLTKLEVKSAKHESFVQLARGTDGTLTDPGGFGEGAFTLRATAMDGQTISHDFSGFKAGELVSTDQQFE